MEAMPIPTNSLDAEREEVYAEVVEHWGWPLETARHYLRDIMHYDLSEPMLNGYREFQARLLKHGFTDCAHFPELVEPSFEPTLSQVIS
jgi:predicted solute-binding protein